MDTLAPKSGRSESWLPSDQSGCRVTSFSERLFVNFNLRVFCRSAEKGVHFIIYRVVILFLHINTHSFRFCPRPDTPSTVHTQSGMLGTAPKTGPKQWFWAKTRFLPTIWPVQEGGGGWGAEGKYGLANTRKTLTVTPFEICYLALHFR